MTAQLTDVVIEEPAKRAIVRHPSDLLRLVLGVGATIVGLLLATFLDEISEAVTIEVIHGADQLPNSVVVSLMLFIALFSVAIPVAAVGYLAWRRQWRRLGLALLASVAAIGIFELLEVELVNRFSNSSLPFTPPTWICEPGTEAGFSFSCVPGTGGGLASMAFIVGGVAFYSALAPWMTRRWRRAAWIAITVIALERMLSSLAPPVDEFLAIGIAYVVGAAVLLIFGEPDRRPRGKHLVAALARSGIELGSLKRAGVDARGSTPYFGTDRSGQNLFIKVLTEEERAADILFRVMRMARLKGVGDERPFSSLKRAVEHEAVVALKAASDGIHTPRLEAVVDIPPSSMAMAYAMIDGSSLDSVPVEELTDDVLAAIWAQVALLRTRRTAHRDLRLANVFLDDTGTPWIIDFGFSELAATDGQLRSDIAELVASTATVVGADRAVAAAIAGVGPEVVSDAAQRIQPIALSGATREAMKHNKGLFDEVRAAIEDQTGTDTPPLEDLERVKGKTVLMIVGFALAIYFLIPQLTQTDFGAVLDANWEWAPAILVASFITYVAAAYNVMGSVPDRIRLVPTVFAQFAGTFINRITPVKVGGMATAVRYLQKSGVDTTVAVAGIGISSVATFLVHMSMLVLFVVFMGRNAGDFVEVPSGTTVLIGLVVLFTLSGLVVFLPVGRRIFRTKVWPLLKKSGQGLAQVATSPSKALMLFGGAFLMILSYIGALWFSLEAFGGGLSFFAIGLVFLAAQALGQAAPTPGGIGATEAAMIAAMTGMGLDAATAVPTVFLYRIATFWLPILPGFLSLRKLEHDDLL